MASSDFDGWKKMEEHVLLEMASLERSTVPDHRKTSHRPGGTRCTTLVGIGDERSHKWEPVIRARRSVTPCHCAYRVYGYMRA